MGGEVGILGHARFPPLDFIEVVIPEDFSSVQHVLDNRLPACSSRICLIASGMNLKILALDYGDARIGVARSDDLGMLAHPVMTVPAQPWPAAAGKIAALVTEHRATLLLVGLPVREDGTEGTAAEKVRKFCGLLTPLLPVNFLIKFHDEYRSTETAKQQLRAAGRKEKNQRSIIDQVAAVVILQEYLDQQAAAMPLPEFM